MKVKYLNFTVGSKCKCSSWIMHWKKFSGKKIPVFCCVNGCFGTDLVGGHVLKDITTDKDWYVIPICTVCNSKKGQDLDIADTTVLIPVNKSETCEQGFPSKLYSLPHNFSYQEKPKRV